MRLLMIAQDFPPDVGGIQTYGHMLASRFAARCEDFALVAPAHANAAHLDTTCAYPVIRVPVPRDTMRFSALPWLMKLTSSGRFDTIFMNHWYAAASTQWLKRLGKVARIFSGAHAQEVINAPVPTRALRHAYDRHRRAMLRTIDGFFPVSQYTRRALMDAGVPDDKITVVSNGADPTWIQQGDDSSAALESFRRRHGVPDGPLLLTVARLVSRKGIDTVIDTMPRVVQTVPDAQYLVVGHGPEQEALDRRAQALGISDRVHFTGRVSEEDLRLAYKACDVFVMPAREVNGSVEGFGLVFLEANACAKPVIGATTGGIPDAIRDGETGLLVPPDAPDALCDAVTRLLTQPSLRRRLGETGRAWVEGELTWDRAADRIMSGMSAAR